MKPQQPTKQIILRITEDRKYQLRVQAAKNNMSINQYLNFLIEQNINPASMPMQQAYPTLP